MRSAVGHGGKDLNPEGRADELARAADDPVCRLANLYAGRPVVRSVEGGASLKRVVTSGPYLGHLQGRVGQDPEETA